MAVTAHEDMAKGLVRLHQGPSAYVERVIIGAASPHLAPALECETGRERRGGNNKSNNSSTRGQSQWAVVYTCALHASRVCVCVCV